MDQTWTPLKLIKWSSDYLAKHGFESTQLESEILLSESLGLKRLDLYLNYDKPLSDIELSNFKTIIKKRLQNIPYQYIFNKAYFRDLILYVNPDVLIPRPETELLVDLAISKIEQASQKNHSLTLLDVGCGSGCITLALARQFPNYRILALDKSSAALAVTAKNVAQYQLANVELINCSIENYDLNTISTPVVLVSNPPYIKTDALSSLQYEVRLEPEIALDGGIQGMDFYHIILQKVLFFRNPIELCFEFGFDQKELMEALFVSSGMLGYEFYQDYDQQDRLAYTSFFPGGQ